VPAWSQGPKPREERAPPRFHRGYRPKTAGSLPARGPRGPVGRPREDEVLISHPCRGWQRRARGHCQRHAARPPCPGQARAVPVACRCAVAAGEMGRAHRHRAHGHGSRGAALRLCEEEVPGREQPRRSRSHGSCIARSLGCVCATTPDASAARSGFARRLGAPERCRLVSRDSPTTQDRSLCPGSDLGAPLPLSSPAPRCAPTPGRGFGARGATASDTLPVNSLCPR
jgi:hypothetical protein